MKTKAILSFSALVFVSLHPAAGLAQDQLTVNINSFDSNASPVHLRIFQQDSTSSSLSGSLAPIFGSTSASVYYGGLSLYSTAFSDNNPTTLVSAAGSWTDSFTITPTDASLIGTTGVARFTFSVGGSISASGIADANDGARWSAGIAGTGYSGNTSTNGIQPGSVGTVVKDVAFTFGGAPGGVGVSGSVSANVQSSPNANATASLTISGGSFTVLTQGGAPVNYTAISSTGASAGTNVTSGNSFSGISLANSGISSHGTTASLIGGTATSDRAVNLGFVAPPSADGSILGDVVDVTGLGSTPGAETDLFVLKLTYNLADALSKFSTAANLQIKWFDTATGEWKLATDGDFGGTPTFINGAFDLLNDLHLGYYGLDTADNSVWGVFNHNSEFAVGEIAPVPEPSTLFMGLFSTLAFAAIRRRRRF